ncbi:MAG TPA: NAD(P)H-dependent glycerol-3-phosphate dehydrogenase [Gemmatimonadales bacterium]|nr:NAD(P)H-dependent glycerol-3-phosphate dehydrogenase [Gemmatimonadales bacterium]
MTAIGVLGAGTWGTVLANHLAGQGHDVQLWARDEELARVIGERHQNPIYLSGRVLSDRLRATSDLGAGVRGREVVVCAVPSQGVGTVLGAAAANLGTGTILVCASKGIEVETLRRMSEIAAETLPGRPYVVLSGPSFATEVLEGQPTAVVAASVSGAAAARVQDLFTAGPLRVYTSADVIGTELAGACKNVIAIAAGMCEGLALGHNPRAALVTRGLAEMSRLGMALGADPLTFSGLAGVGDLVLTSWGSLSRNRTLGSALGRGETLAAYLERNRVVVEGVPTARAALRLAAQAGVEMPISAKVAECLFEGKSPRRAIAELMERPPKPEHWT